jgi:hypothetical protein
MDGRMRQTHIGVILWWQTRVNSSQHQHKTVD